MFTVSTLYLRFGDCRLDFDNFVLPHKNLVNFRRNTVVRWDRVRFRRGVEVEVRVGIGSR